eukprot:3325596-Prymnesium_polylepis.1
MPAPVTPQTAQPRPEPLPKSYFPTIWASLSISSLLVLTCTPEGRARDGRMKFSRNVCSLDSVSVAML